MMNKLLRLSNLQHQYVLNHHHLNFLHSLLH
uniref:Uncharacterized protein n=1 Tax=Lepeophtheirus salmonis TaxID=72036 RepID=A0A0K2U6S4_LEPSM